MFDHTHYVPVLRWKAGEKRALKGLSREDKARMTPLLEWSRPGEVAPDEDREIPTPEPRELAKDILRHWGARSFFYDAHQFWAGNLGHDSVLLRRYARELTNGGLRPIPVFNLLDEKSYHDALASLSSRRGVCVRLAYSEIAGGKLAGLLREFSAATRYMPAATHLIADFETHYREMDIVTLCAQLPELGRYLTFTVAAGSFPVDLREFKGPQVFYLAREEWVRWHDQMNRPLPRRPTFGDYITLNPTLTAAARGLNPSATIRYTAEDHWLVMKGEGLHTEDGPGYDQYPANARLLMERADYCGAEFSDGDRYIRDVAVSGAGPGNPTTWVQAGVNHHLVFVVRQLEEFFQRGLRREGTARLRIARRGKTATGPSTSGETDETVAS